MNPRLAPAKIFTVSRCILGIGLAAALLPASLSAKDITLDQTLVDHFDPASVQELFATLDATSEPVTLDNGEKAFHFKFDNGLGGYAVPTACKDKAAMTGCSALSLAALFAKPDGKAIGDVAALANEFNKGHGATQVSFDAQGNSQVIKYVIGEFGVTKTNLVLQVYAFRLAASEFSTALFGT